MARRGFMYIVTGALVLSVAPNAFAQIPEAVPPLAGRAGIVAYTGEVTPFGYVPPTIPSDWIYPSGYVPYPVPRPVYVPVPTAPSRPRLEPILVDIISLRADAPLSSLRVRRDTVVMWMNAGDRELSLVLEAPGTTGPSSWASRQSGVIRVNGTLSLAFHRPGTYVYFMQNQPDRRAQIIVE